MKRICILLILLQITMYFFIEYGRIFIDNERAGIMLLRGGYRSYSIVYSNGLLMSDPTKNLWCLPRFNVCDIRKYLEK